MKRQEEEQNVQDRGRNEWIFTENKEKTSSRIIFF